MLIKRASDIPSSEITSENLYHNRREFIKTASAVLGITAAGAIIPGCAPGIVGAAGESQAKKGQYDTTEKPTPIEDITTYNNYYEFGTGKDDPSEKMGPKYDTPTLLGVYRSAPYLHHGKAKTLHDVLTTCNQDDKHGKTSQLKPDEVDDLVAFLKSLPYEKPPDVTPNTVKDRLTPSHP